MQGELAGVDAQVHAELSRLGAEHKKIDSEVMSWLPIAIERSLHLKLGMGSMLEYCERVLGYDVHTARERIRVAKALLDLPKTHEAVAAGDVSYTAAREITRVATDDTEAEWIALARSRNAREVERAVAGRRQGDLPSSPPSAAAMKDDLIFSVTAEDRAVILAAVDAVRKSIDTGMSAGAALALICRRPAPAESTTLPARPALAMIQCEECARGWADVRGDRSELDPQAVERRLCDPKVTDGVGKKTVEIPLATRRAVWRRDRGRCVVPGCRNHMFVEIHHLRSILEGGDHSMDNLAALCDAHHDALHRGLLTIVGVPSTGLTFEDAHARAQRLWDHVSVTRPDLDDLTASPGGRRHDPRTASPGGRRHDPFTASPGGRPN